MLRGIINHAASAAGSMVAGYVARAFVAVPFIIGLGFATAALSLLLIDHFGHRDAYLMIAGIFTLVGALAALIASGKERRTENPTARATGPKFKPVDLLHRRSMATGTFVIVTLLVGAALYAAVASFAPALPSPYFIS
jgi:hypothetical protein